MADYRYIELEETNARLQRDDDNKLMWDLWKQVQTSKPDITQIIATTVDREAKKYAAKEQHIWSLLEERDTTIKHLEQQLDTRDSELKSLSKQIIEMKSNEAALRSRYAESATIEERLKDEVDRLNKQLMDSDEVNNRLLVSLEKENTALKNEVECVRAELCESENKVLTLKSSYEAANNSSSTLWSELASYRQMVTIMEAELNELRNTTAELRKSFDEKQAELECVLANKEKIADELNQYLARDLEFKVEALTTRNRELEAECALRHTSSVSPHTDSGTFMAPEKVLIEEIRNLKEQLARVTVAYEAKSLENEMLSKKKDRLNAIEQLHSEQRTIQEGLDGLDQRLKKDKHEYPADLVKELEASLETERLVALLKQHCRELANDRDVFAGRLEKALLQLANRESSIADLKVRLANIKRDRESELRTLNAECERKLCETSKQYAGKLTSEVSRQKNELAALGKKMETVQAERRRLRSQLTACQARLAREGGLSARQHDRIVELEQTILAHSEKLAEARSQIMEQQKDNYNRRRRTRSASFCSQEDTPPRPKKKMLAFDMATQTDLCGFQVLMQPDRQLSSSLSTTTTTYKTTSRKTSTTHQQLNVEKMRVARLLRLCADLKTDRMKLRRATDDERQMRLKSENTLMSVRSQLNSYSSANQLLENKLAVVETELAHTRTALVESHQRVAELSLISPRVDKSVITDQMDSSSTDTPLHVPVEAYEELKERISVMLSTEREQAARLTTFQLEHDRIASDLALTKERLNDSRREHAKDRRICEEQRGKLQTLEQQVSTDTQKIKELNERLAYAERTDKSATARMAALKRRIEECETDKASLKKALTDKQSECERLSEQAKKAKTRCQYLEVMTTAEKDHRTRLETECQETVNNLQTECKESTKKIQSQLSLKTAQLGEFQRCMDMYLDLLIEQIRHDRRLVSKCETSSSHKNKSQPQGSPVGRRASSQQSDGSLASRAASIAQAHLKLSAEEAAELLMVGSVDASPPSSVVGFDSPDAFYRKVSNILRQIFACESGDEDSALFANRLSDALFHGFTDHIRFLVTRPQCCLNAVAKRGDRFVVVGRSSGGGDCRLRRLSSSRHFNANSSAVGALSDSVFSGSPY